MDTLAVITAIIGLGFEMRVKTVKAVRNNTDVNLVIVHIGEDFSGEGETPAEALSRAFAAMRERVQRRHDRDGQILLTLTSAIQ